MDIRVWSNRWDMFWFLLGLPLKGGGVLHIYPPVIEKRQTLTIGWCAHFSLHQILRAWRNPHLLRGFWWFNVLVNFFKFLSTEFAACSKPPNRDNHRKASYPKTQQRDQSKIKVVVKSDACTTQSRCRLRSCKKRHKMSPLNWEWAASCLCFC